MGGRQLGYFIKGVLRVIYDSMTQRNIVEFFLSSRDAHRNLERFMTMEKPGTESIVLAIETLESEARTYVNVLASGETDQYETVMDFFNGYYHPHGRHIIKRKGKDGKITLVYPAFPYAVHEVIRAGLNRRVMFDVDLTEKVNKDTLLRYIRILKAACRTAYESYGNVYESDLSDDAFRVMISDAKAPFKGFHLLLTTVMMPAASIARLYCAVREVLATGAVGAREDCTVITDALDDKPAGETFNMRLYGSPKINRVAGRKMGVSSRQKRLLDFENDIIYDFDADLRELLIQPGIARSDNDLLIHQVTLHPDDEGVRRSVTRTVEGENAWADRLDLLKGWEARGEVKTGERDGKSWWRQDLTLVGGERHVCSVCDRIHPSRTDYLWLTGEGLVDTTKPVYVRCRSRVQTAAEKEADNYRFNVVATIPGIQTSPLIVKEPLVAPALKYAFNFEGYTGKPLKTPLTTFLDAQKSAHLVAIEAADRSAATKRAEKIQLNADLAAAVAHQIAVMERAAEEQKDASNPLYDALEELETKGADYEIYGQRDFCNLYRRVYKSEYEMLCAIHCNAWKHNMEGSAVWHKGVWKLQTWYEPDVTKRRNRMMFRVQTDKTSLVTRYGGKDFWDAIVTAYDRVTETSFTPYPLGRSAIGLPSPAVWQMYEGINNYAGLHACPLPQSNPDRLVRQQHRDVFEHFLRSQIAGEGDEYYRYLMGWLASAMQRPHEKIGVALLIRGPMGCGKSILISLLSAIVPHATTVTNKGLRTLTDKFNTDLENRTLYMFGEVGETSRAGLTGDQVAAIKTLITDDVQEIEAKFKAMKRQKQYLNIIVCSNMLNCIETGEGDRRWCVMDTSCPVHDKDDSAYWKRVYPLFTSDKSFAASIQELLLDYDLSNHGLTGFDPKEYPKSEALQVTRRELPIVNYALKYPNLRQRVTEYLQDKPEYEPDRPATLRDIVICQRVDEGSESARSDTIEQQEKDLYYAMSNIPQVKQRFSSHPDSDGGRMTRITAAGRQEVLKLAIVWGEDDQGTSPQASLSCSAAVRDRDAAMAKMIAMMKAAGLDVSDFVKQFPALGDGPERYDSMGRDALRALLKERGLSYTGRDSVAVLRAKLREQACPSD